MSSRATEIISASETIAVPSSQTPSAVDRLPDELLLAILGELSIRDRTKILRVSKKWNDLVMDLGIYLDPLFVDEREGIPFYSDEIPVYRRLWAIDTDFDGANEILQADFPRLALFRVCTSDSLMMHLARSEYLTSPPISTLAFQVTGPPGTPRQPMTAVLRTATPTARGSGGIRFGDLLDMLDKMRAYDTKLSLVGWRFAAWYGVQQDWSRYDIICERACTRNGIEVRKRIGEDG
jgi:hypothetical protein